MTKEEITEKTTSEEAPSEVISVADLDVKEESKEQVKASVPRVESGGSSIEEDTKKVAKKKKRKKGRAQLSKGNVYIQATYNNTLISVTDARGNVVAQASAGACGFKGPKKATPYAASVVVKALNEKLKDTGLVEVDVFVKGIGQGRDMAIRTLNQQGYRIHTIKDITPMPHNGPRPKKAR